MGVVKRELGPELNRGDRAACDKATCHDPADYKGRRRYQNAPGHGLHHALFNRVGVYFDRTYGLIGVRHCLVIPVKSGKYICR